jgi:hypothetical protein
MFDWIPDQVRDDGTQKVVGIIPILRNKVFLVKYLGYRDRDVYTCAFMNHNSLGAVQLDLR